ncbi:MAG: glycoside-pentoside-hexuronide (GPH):cation symporter [Terracidiphilus sp.]|jgi:GPH family glycoside/pentoside/hexuronide:cation symporter
MKSTVLLASRIPLMEKIGYSLGDSASNLYWKTFEFFLVIFYTDVFGISSRATGTLLVVTGLVSAVADLMMGSIADRMRTRWGHFRPYFLFGSGPLAVAGVLTFTTPHLCGGEKLLYAYITYGSLMLIYTAVNVPYCALMGVMTPSSVERTSISSVRFMGAFIAGLFVQCFTLSFVKFFGRGSDADGWRWTMVLYGALAVLLLLLCFFSTHEQVIPSPQQNSNIKYDFHDLFRSRAWLVLVAVQLLTVSAFTVKGAASAYYFKYFVGRQDLLWLFLVSNGLAFLVAVSITSRLAKLVGKRQLMIIELWLGAVLVGLFSFAKPLDIWLIFALQIISSFVIGFKSPLIFAMFADIADHIEWRTGRRATGVVFASAIFATKIGMAMGAWLFGLVLAYSGYLANVEQTERSLRGIILSMSWIPAAITLMAALGMASYPLSDAVMVKIEKELEARRGVVGI